MMLMLDTSDKDEGESFEIDQGDEIMAGNQNKNNGHRTFQQKCLIGTFSAFIILLAILIGLLVSSPSLSSTENNSAAANGRSNAYFTDGSSRDSDPQWRIRPTNLHLVFVGDSIMHYQYLSLVYFLRTGRWFDQTFRKSHLTNVYSYESLFHDDVYGEYFFQTTRQLQPYEICDCVYPRTSAADSQYRFNETQVVINRYFRDPHRNNTVRFFHAFGHEHELQGRLNATKIPSMEGKEQDGLLNGQHVFQPKDIVWKTKSWADLVHHQIASLIPKPKYMVLNAGKHSSDFATDPNQVQQLHESLNNLGLTKAFWRTTTYKRGGKPVNGNTPVTDQMMCQQLGGCLSTEWTQQLNVDMYWDEHHNYEPVYRVVNEDLLESIGLLPNGYVKFDRTLLY